MGWPLSLCHTAPRYPAEDLMEWCASIWFTSRREKWCSHPTEVTSVRTLLEAPQSRPPEPVLLRPSSTQTSLFKKTKSRPHSPSVLGNAPTITLKASTWRRPTVCRSSSDRCFDPGCAGTTASCTGSCGHAWPYRRNSGLAPAGPDGLHVTHQLPPQHRQHPLHIFINRLRKESYLYTLTVHFCVIPEVEQLFRFVGPVNVLLFLPFPVVCYFF